MPVKIVVSGVAVFVERLMPLMREARTDVTFIPVIFSGGNTATPQGSVAGNAISGWTTILPFSL